MLTINQQIQEIKKGDEISINNYNVLCATNLQPYISLFTTLQYIKSGFIALSKKQVILPHPWMYSITPHVRPLQDRADVGV